MTKLTSRAEPRDLVFSAMANYFWRLTDRNFHILPRGLRTNCNFGHFCPLPCFVYAQYGTGLDLAQCTTAYARFRDDDVSPPEHFRDVCALCYLYRR